MYKLCAVDSEPEPAPTEPAPEPEPERGDNARFIYFGVRHPPWPCPTALPVPSPPYQLLLGQNRQFGR